MLERDQPAAVARRRLAWACAVLMLVVVVASAWLRHFGASAALHTAGADGLAAVRQVHRVAATLALLGAVALVAMAWRARDRIPLVLASALLGVALLLSVVGVMAGASRAAPVVLVNLIGGFAMLALCARLAAAPSSTGMGGAAIAMLALLGVQAALGVAAGARVASQTEPWALLHRSAGMVLVVALVVVGLAAVRRLQRPAGAMVAWLAVALLLAGALAATDGGAALLVLHGAMAAAAAALLTRLV